MAASNLRDIKRRIKSVDSTAHITNAMKLVSSAKLRRAKATHEKVNKYLHFIRDSIEEVFKKASDVPEEYTKSKTHVDRTCYIVITGNRGLCGGFNSSVIKRALQEMDRELREESRENPLLVTIGLKGKEYFSKRGFEIESEYLSPPEDISFIDTQTGSKPIVDLYREDKIDKIVLIHNRYVDSFRQEVKMQTLLPYVYTQSADEKQKQKKYIEYEPSMEEVLNYLIPKYVEVMIYGAMIESATSEHAARRMAMENASENAKDMIAKLNLSFNQARQAAITNEISEVVRGAETLR